MLNKITASLCKLIGHSWRYKDYSYWMSESGDEYPFKASRNCSRCNQHEYLYREWEIRSGKSPHDLERDSESSEQIPQLQKQL
jgi:hypothetical protein